MKMFVRNEQPIEGVYRETCWERSPNVRERLNEPVSAEVLAATILTESTLDLEWLPQIVEGVCCELVNLLQAGLVDVVEVSR